MAMQLRTISWLNLGFLLATVAVNAAANAVPLNGLNTGQVSDMYPNRFVPDGFTFSIWSVIYMGLFAFCFFSIAAARKEHALSLNASVIKKVSPLFWLSCLLNMSWIFAWHYLQIELSIVLMLAMLVTLTSIFLRLQAVQGRQAFWLALVPFTLYFSWICVATIANTTALLVHYNWDGLGIEAGYWSVIMQVVALVLSVFVSLRYRSAAYALVTAWALAGIWRGQADSQLVSSSAIILALIAVVLAVYAAWRYLQLRPVTSN